MIAVNVINLSVPNALNGIVDVVNLIVYKHGSILVELECVSKKWVNLKMILVLTEIVMMNATCVKLELNLTWMVNVTFSDVLIILNALIMEFVIVWENVNLALDLPFMLMMDQL